MLTSYWGYVNNLIIEYILKLAKGAFFNYVDKNLDFFDHLPTYACLTFVKEFLLLQGVPG